MQSVVSRTVPQKLQATLVDDYDWNYPTYCRLNNAMPLELTPIEEEVVYLKATLDAVNSMVNFEMMSLHGSDPDSSILFETRTHQRFFNIALVDFLSRTDKKAPVKQIAYLGALRAIAEDPHFNIRGSVAGLLSATTDFSRWLEDQITVDVWFPSIELQTLIRLPRVQYIKMTGDLSKHNLLRSVGVAEDLKKLLAEQGVHMEIDAAMLALENFYEWFHDHVLNYHSSTLAEYLNNLRWSIHDYLQPELHRSNVWLGGDPPMYRYTFPAGISSKFGQNTFWGLMNLVREKPYMRKFQITKWQKLRF